MAGLAPAPVCGMVLADYGAKVIRVDKVEKIMFYLKIYFMLRDQQGRQGSKDHVSSEDVFPIEHETGGRWTELRRDRPGKEIDCPQLEEARGSERSEKALWLSGCPY